MSAVRHITLFGVALITASCAVGPNFMRPAAPKVERYTEGTMPTQLATAPVAGGTPQTLTSGAQVPEKWWTLFGSAELDRMVEQALAGNPDLQAAEAALRQAQETMRASGGAFLPSIDLAPTVAREKFNPAAFGSVGASPSIFTLYNASVNVSYGLDIFGGTRRAYEAAEAQAEYERFLKEASYVTLTTNVVTTAISEASLREQIKAQNDIIATLAEEKKIVDKQFQLGAVPRTTVLQQETLLAQAQTALPPLQKQLASARHLLATLTGHFPDALPPVEFTLTSLKLPEALPVSLPSQLTEQRPDIRAAEATLHAASAEVGVATAALLPQITISGYYGFESAAYGALFNQGSSIWSLGAGLVQPLFHGGTLIHQKRAAVAAFEGAQAQYRSTVLGAFRNVADVLRALQFDAEGLAAQASAEASAKAALDLAHTQFKLGAISYPQQLDAERAWQQTHIALVQAEGARFADTAALYQALGGGWWLRGSIPTSATATTLTTPTNGKTP